MKFSASADKIFLTSLTSPSSLVHSFLFFSQQGSYPKHYTRYRDTLFSKGFAIYTVCEKPFPTTFMHTVMCNLSNLFPFFWGHICELVLSSYLYCSYYLGSHSNKSFNTHVSKHRDFLFNFCRKKLI